MWHEARKQEKMIRGMIVDYRRRAERRRNFYEKIKADPTQFLQLHGRPFKIHLDPAIAVAGDSPAIMMPWQGDQENMIDRFDVRAHLDYIPEIKTPDMAAEDLDQEERNCNYERYRILAQNLFLGIGEEKFLHQLQIEEQFGVTLEEKEMQKEKMAEKKNTGVAIGYNYDEKTAFSDSTLSVPGTSNNEDKDDSEDESDLEIIDVDLSIDVNKVESPQAHAMNTCGTNFGMVGTDLFSFLTGDAHDAERQRQILRDEKEKALFSGRKSRRERRAHRDKKLALRVASPPHYAARPSTPPSVSRNVPSPVRSLSPPEPVSNAITFITSFGGDDDNVPESEKSPMRKTTYADKLKINSVPGKSYASALREGNKKRLKRSRSPSPKKSDWSPYNREKKSRSPGSRTWNPRDRSKSHESSSSDSRSRSRDRSKSRSRERRRRSSTDRSSRSYSRNRSGSRASNRSRSGSSISSNSSRGGRRQSDKFGNGHRGPGGSGGGQAAGPSASRVPRYYGRKREGYNKSSSSELSLDSSDDQSNTTDKTNDNLAGSKTSQVTNVVRNSGASSKYSRAAQERLSLKERLRKKMQAQLSRQLRADKKAEADRHEREQQLQQERDDEMREMAIRIRRKQREMRHQRRNSQSSEDHDSSSSPSRSPKQKRTKNSEERESDKEESLSPAHKAPERKKIPVWEHEENLPDRSVPPPEPSYSRRDYSEGNDQEYRDNPRFSSNRYNTHRPYNQYNNRGTYNRGSYSRNFNEDRGSVNNRSTFENRNRDQSSFRGKTSWDGNKRGFVANRFSQRSFNRYSEEGNKYEYNNYEEPDERFRRGRGESYDGEENYDKPSKRLVDY